MNNKRKIGLLVCALICTLACAMVLAGCSEKAPADTGSSKVSVTPAADGAEDTAEEAGEEPALSEEAKKLYQFAEPADGDLCAEIVIEKYGSVYVHLFPEVAPRAVENFTELAKKGYYDGNPISKVIADYLVQAGSPDGDATGGESIYGGGFYNEISEKLLPVRGALCMANLGTDGTNTSQFFWIQTTAKSLEALEKPLENRYHMDIYSYLQEAYQTTLTPEQWKFYKQYGGAPWLYGHHTVFGQVYDGFAVMDQIAKAKVTSKLKPNPRIVITTIRIFEKGAE